MTLLSLCLPALALGGSAMELKGASSQLTLDAGGTFSPPPFSLHTVSKLLQRAPPTTVPSQEVITASAWKQLIADVAALKATTATTNIISSSTAPVCNSANEGGMYFNTVSRTWQGCDGDQFQQLEIAKPYKSTAVVEQLPDGREVHAFLESGEFQTNIPLTVDVRIIFRN